MALDTLAKDHTGQDKPTKNKDAQSKIETIYPLSPSQQGMLFDSLSAQMLAAQAVDADGIAKPQMGGKYIEISVYDIEGPLDLQFFQKAWQLVSSRHPVLRSGYVWEGQAEPLQFILRQLSLPVDFQDCRTLSAAEQAEKVTNYIQERRTTGFNLAKPPLVSLALFQLDDEIHRFVWAIHHILIDGWSLPILLHDVVAFYEADKRGERVQLPLAPPYQTYIQWLKSQDRKEAAQFWQTYLQGVKEPTPLGVTPQIDGKGSISTIEVTQIDQRYASTEQSVSPETIDALQAVAQQNRLVLNTLLRGLWACLLRRYSGQSDVVFGATTSGRPATVQDVESIVGLFINTVPIRMTVADEQPFLEWLQPYQAESMQVEEYSYCSNGQIHGWTEVPGSHPIFESILVFQNYSVSAYEERMDAASINLKHVESIGARTPYPLTIMVKQNAGLTVELIYDTSRFQSADVEQVLAHWGQLLDTIAKYPNQSLKQLIDQIPVAQIPRFIPHSLEQSSSTYASATTDPEAHLVKIWEEVLGIHPIGVHDNFFDLGGHSLLLAQIRKRLQAELNQDVKIVDLLTYPTISGLSQHLYPAVPTEDSDGAQEGQPQTRQNQLDDDSTASNDIAIVGMAGRFPGAASVAELWQHLCQGDELITFFSPEELAEAGVPAELCDNPNYVPANGVLEDFDCFDAAFFGISPREAKSLNPQHRLFLETVWTAIEDAGYDLERYKGAIGLYAGGGMNTYNVQSYHGLTTSEDMTADFQEAINGDREFLATRVSYKLNLHGPSVTVHAACSTSLVAIHMACQSLRNGECDMAAAGGISVSFFAKEGYLYQEGMIASPDGHCRAFDAQAGGTVAGNGMGAILCKRLDQALADGDVIHAVIKGTAINNDGSDKVGYTAPSVRGQIEVIKQAYANAGVDASTIGYVEAHGTGTGLGDPMEVAALKQAFNQYPERESACALGSIKTNIGHLGEAAGVSGLIKAVLALKHQQLPPTLHFTTPNPELGLEDSPFYVNTELQSWENGKHPRRAAVSSFGIGGTNAHAILEEAPISIEKMPSLQTDEEAPACHLLTLSAKSDAALDMLVNRYIDFLDSNDSPDNDAEIELARICYTTHVGRAHLPKRLAITATSIDELREKLTAVQAKKSVSGIAQGQINPGQQPRVAFLFTGQGSQYVNMGRELYETHAPFREILEYCDERLQVHLGQSVLGIIYPDQLVDEDEKPMAALSKNSSAEELLNQTVYTQSALFVIEYALAQLWQSWGIQPSVVMGHSIGEIVAACVAGVFSLEDGLKMVAARGRLMQSLPARGSMVAVRASEDIVQSALELFADKVAIAAINGPQNLVVSGHSDAVQAVVEILEADGVRTRALKVSHAFHSPLMEPMLDDFAKVAAEIKYHAPKVSLVSNLTGQLISDSQAIDSPTHWEYWVQHVRQPVRFADSVAALYAEGCDVLLEIGPKPTLVSMARQIPQETSEPRSNSQNETHSAIADSILMIPSLRQGGSNWQQMMDSLGKLYLHNASVKWQSLTPASAQRKVTLPTYPFERKRYWKDLAAPKAETAGAMGSNSSSPDAIKAWLAESHPEEITQLLVESGQLPNVVGHFVAKLMTGAGFGMANTSPSLFSFPNGQATSGDLTNGFPAATEVVQQPEAPIPDSGNISPQDIQGELNASDRADHQGIIINWLQRHVASTLGYADQAEAAFEPYMGPGTAGMDSLLVLDLRIEIENRLKVNVPIANLLTTTFTELADLILSELAQDMA